MNRDLKFASKTGEKVGSFRSNFFIPVDSRGRELIYFAGNSLGLQPRSVREYIEQELADWEHLGVEGHLKAKNPWMPYHEFLTEKTARLAGAKPEEVVNMNSLTVNLHLMMVSFYRPTKKRNKILIEANAFPSDRYAVQSQIKFHGFSPQDSMMEIKPREGENWIRTEDIEELIRKEGERISLILLGGVNYYTGQAFNFERITKAGHEMGCVVAFDLAHAIGNLVLKLHDWDVAVSYTHL
ncbi:MAG: aminotransferase class V-fold PLP-dependent enzyme, partial [Ignavibacteria bacterium]|nr:aminotransferase class V-fold PLP-dependent enzyme [Ignavibacteria bacterium]